MSGQLSLDGQYKFQFELSSAALISRQSHSLVHIHSTGGLKQIRYTYSYIKCKSFLECYIELR